MKLSLCRKLNYFEHYDILEYLENNKLNEFLNSLGVFSSLKLYHYCKKELYVIIHPSTKRNNMFQITYFDDNGPVSDTVHKSLIDCVKTVFSIYSIIDTIIR